MFKWFKRKKKLIFQKPGHLFSCPVCKGSITHGTNNIWSQSQGWIHFECYPETTNKRNKLKK